MGYNRENYIRIREEYEGKSLRAKQAAERRAEELRAAFPTLPQSIKNFPNTVLPFCGKR